MPKTPYKNTPKKEATKNCYRSDTRVTMDELLNNMFHIMMKNETILSSWADLSIDARECILKLVKETINIYIRNGYILTDKKER